jgi:hypothetical protein
MLRASGDGSLNTFELPWSPDKATWIQFSSEAELFVTPQLTGCSVMVGGSRTKPIIVHANFANSPDLDSASTELAATLDRSGFFSVENDGSVTSTACFDSSAIGKLTATNALDGCVAAHVFGVRESAAGGWSVYGHIAVTLKSDLRVRHSRAVRLWPQ